MIGKNSQKGMALVELLVAVAITGLIVGGLGTAIYMIVTATERGNDEATVLHDIRNPSYWISYDAQMTDTTDLVDGDPGVDSMILEWIDEHGNSHYSSYSLSGTELKRTYDGMTTTVARYVSSIEFSISGNLLTFHLESAMGGRWDVSQETTGIACLRPKT